MKWWLTSALLLGTGAAWAQTPAVPVEAAGVEGDEVARVMVDYAEVRAGPGEAYVSRGRVYQGDKVQVKRRADTGAWMEVVAGGGVTGWLRTGDLKIVPGERIKPTVDDPGRDRRQTNYTYDENGRRRRLDGRAVGSGEGARTQTPEDVDLDDFGSSWGAAPSDGSSPAGGAGRLSVRLGVGAGRMERDFSSNAPADSLLGRIASRPVGYGAALDVDYSPLWFLTVHGAFRDLRFAETQLQTARYNNGQPFGLAVDRQEGALDVGGRYPFGAGHAEVYVGGRYWRQAFQELQPVSLLLTTTVIGVAGGAEAGYAFGPVDVTARGGVVLPLSIEQSPTDSGEPEALAFEASLTVAYAFTESWAAYVGGYYSKLTIDHSGPATQVDPDVGEPPTYTVARTIDSTIGGTVGVRWQL